MEIAELHSLEEFDQYMKEKGKVQISDRELSDDEKAAMAEARRLGINGISNSPVSIESIFNYINSVKFCGLGIFARIETASETSKYQTGSKILSIYSFSKKLFTLPECVQGRKLVELQISNGDYMCTDRETPYRPQIAYYSFSYSKSSLFSWKKLENFESYTTAKFVSELLIHLRNMLMEEIRQDMDAITMTYADNGETAKMSDRKRVFKQISNELEKYSKQTISF